MAKYRTAGVGSVVGLGKALASAVRVRALEAIRRRELCLCELAELLGLAPSTMSKHMALLVRAGLAASRRQGRWTYYARAKELPAEIAEALAIVDGLSARDPVVREDESRIQTLACR